MDFKKIINAAKFPTVLLTVLGAMWVLIGLLLSRFPDSGLIIIVVLGGGVFVIQCLVIIWIGYSKVKKYQFDLLDATLTAGLASAISTTLLNLITSIILIVLLLVAYIAPSTTSKPLGTIGGAVGAVFNVISLLIVSAISVVWWGVISLIGGLVLGAIGGFIAERTNSQEKPSEKKPKQF